VYEYNITSCAAHERTLRLLREAERERIARHARASTRRRWWPRLEEALRYLRPQRESSLAREI
jgi:hypothetical protein